MSPPAVRVVAVVLYATRTLGMRLDVGRDQLDADEIERLAAEGRDALAGGDPAEAATFARRAVVMARAAACRFQL
jgi:hypothetical protein